MNGVFSPLRIHRTTQTQIERQAAVRIVSASLFETASIILADTKIRIRGDSGGRAR